MIIGFCATNLDEYKKEQWPKVFVAVPRPGERVQAESGRSLKVAKVTHMSKFMGEYDEHKEVPFIAIELHKV